MAKPVVVGVDGSPSSLEAVETAAHEAALSGVGLRLVHAFGWSSIHPPHGGPTWNRAEAGVRELVDGTLVEAELRAHRIAPDTDIHREVTVGEPVVVLEIESRTASLVVVGSRGLGGFGGLLLGSTAVHLAAYGRCPVLVVRGRPDPAGPVLLAVDGSPAGERAVEFAFAEASVRGADLLALHVWNAWSERVPEGPDDQLRIVVDVDRLREEEQRLLDETLSPWRTRYPRVAVEQRLVRSRIRPALIEASRDAQLVVAGARGRGGFGGLLLGSVSQALLQHAHCPVAVVRGRE
ncbi:Nucleotide-binding universal stress protein, UspA family [Streptomyces misionensis]|uniref:Nucleotide-binding universal stress protein, UspA family n=1 Tax=Streptomyces misionensis TaxID=67331 RepID=A0A1H4XCQ8_9ACTN|nr:universal stress protein [Streptomyces misionensis]SED03393.1 Nucleotide-binding universal stress protein, UspA family [Streptomyces misionensis]